MKTPLHYQMTEYDCGPISMMNAIIFLFDREQIPPDLIRNIMLYCLDGYGAEGAPGRSGTTRAAMMFLSNFLGSFGRTGQLDLSARYLSGSCVRVSQNSAITDCLRRGGAVVVRLYLLDEPLGALDLKLRKDMQQELKRIQQQMEITFIYVTHDQEEALAMSDTVVVMNEGIIQQIGTPEDIYNEPKNAFVADFIGESNILDGIMREDYVVETFGRRFQCMDKGFAKDEPVDVVVRPEDIDIVPVKDGMLTGTVTSITFKGMQYDVIVDFKGFKWLIQTTDSPEVGQRIGIRIVPDGFHIMHKSKYSGLYGDYSSFSEEYDELSDAEYDPEAEEESSESREESADEE